MYRKLSILLLIMGSFCSFSQKESPYILHQVQAKETLYSLVKKYNTNFATVETLNPELANGKIDIKIGQIIKFPKNTPTQEKTKIIELAKKKIREHVVEPHETVFSISKKYQIDISNLVEANKIISNTIKVGQRLIVDESEIAEIASKTPREDGLHINPLGKKVSETGLAEVISSSNRSTKYLALHRKAPIGSNIRITNEATGHTIVARVIGHLAEKGPDQKIMLKLSPYAYYQLRPTDSRLRATVEYYLPNSSNDKTVD